MYSSAYVYIYTYGVVYIFCIDIQIGLVLSKYHKCFVQSVLPTMSWPYSLFSASVLLFLSWDRVTFIPLGSCSVTGFVHVLLYSRCFFAFFFLWLETFIILSRGSSVWTFHLILMYRMQWKFSSFRLINPRWSFHCFCCVADPQFSPAPRRYIIFLDKSSLLLSFIFQFI